MFPMPLGHCKAKTGPETGKTERELICLCTGDENCRHKTPTMF